MSPLEHFQLQVTPEEIRRWQGVYGQISVSRELAKMEEWIIANPYRAKKNWKRFAVNWLAKAQGQAEAIEQREVVRAELQRQLSGSW